MTVEHNNISKFIEVISHPAAVLLYEWLKPDRSPTTLDARGVGYEIIACRLHDEHFTIIVSGGDFILPRCFIFHPNAVETLRSELRAKISEQGKEQIKYFWPKTALENMIRECQGELFLVDAAQLFEVPETILQLWQQGKFDTSEFPALSNAVCNTIAALRHEIESLEKELEEAKSNAQ